LERKKAQEKEIMRILAVDDELLICDLLYEFLSLQGYEVTSSSSGQEALLKFEESRPDVVILDIRMPGMSGIDVLRKIRDMDSNVVVIMLSAFGDSGTIQEALQSGADYYMEKPLEFDNLMKILNSI
jgi:DNA-binding response OmpR family regulator